MNEDDGDTLTLLNVGECGAVHVNLFGVGRARAEAK